jgi:hypothetical protein
VAIGAHLDMQRLVHGRACLPGVAATAGYLNLLIRGVDVGFHDFFLWRGPGIGAAKGNDYPRNQFAKQ